MVISVKKTMHTRFLALVLSAVLLLPALAGCSKKTGAEKDLAYPIDGEPVCLDPQIAADETAKLVTGNCFEGLVRLDESGAIVPGAAQRWDVSADGRTYTFHLREGMKWHIADSDELEELLGKGKTIDTTLNAEDFAFGLKRALLPETAWPPPKRFMRLRMRGGSSWTAPLRSTRRAGGKRQHAGDSAGSRGQRVSLCADTPYEHALR